MKRNKITAFGVCCAALLLLCSCTLSDKKTAEMSAREVKGKLDSGTKVLPMEQNGKVDDYRNFITKDEKTYAAFQRFMRAVVLTKHKYVDADASTYEALFEKALSGMLNELDPYCSYESKKSMESYQEEMDHEIAGIGVTITTSNRALRVLNVFNGGPADKAGIKAGDLIIEVDDVPLAKIPPERHMKLIPGPAGEKVKLKIHRISQDKQFCVTVTREIVRVSTVLGGKIIDKEHGIGYVALTEFGGKTDMEFAAAMEKLEKAGMKSLILDLRDNPGGLVTTAVTIASHFVPQKEIVVSLETRDPKENKVYKAIPGKKRYKLPMVILMNRGSASASEILAACLRDYNLAVIIGEKSYGKGVVQTFFPLGEDEVMKITSARYFTPKRHMIHGNGIKPDIEVSLPVNTQAKLSYQRDLHPGVVYPSVYGAVKDDILERALNVLSAMKILQK